MAVLEVNGLKKVYTTRFGGSRVQALTTVSYTHLTLPTKA